VSLNRFDARRDSNESEIVEALVLAGARVLRLDKFDLLVEADNRLFMLEVKTKDGQLTKAQQTLLEQGWPLRVVRSIEAALAAIGVE
jgi:hypothetical protein